MAGLLKPNAAGLLVGAIREEFPNLPIRELKGLFNLATLSFI